MDSFKSFVGLSDEEVQLIDESVQEKLLVAFDSIQNDLITNKERVDNVETQKESVTQEYQQKLKELEAKYLALKQRSSEHDDLLQSTDSKYREVYAERNELQSKLADSLSINNELTCVIRTLENDKEILSEQLKHKIDTCNVLNEELRTLKADAESVRKLKLDALFKLEEVASREGSLKTQESRWSDEVAALQRHTDWLEERLRHTTDQLLTIRRDTANKAQSLESELELRNTEVAEEQIRIEQLYGNELEAQKRVVALYKDQLKESEEKNTELTDAVSSMQGMLKSAYESLSEDELRQLNPAVAATLSALKRGHSLTQLYSDYIQLVEDRDQLRLDKQRLTEYVKQLVDDLKEKGALLMLGVTVRTRFTSCFHFFIFQMKVQFLLREVEVLRGTVVEEPGQDLPDSTDTLNKSQLDKIVIRAADLDQMFTNTNSSAAEVIDEHLVTWRSLGELQSQNQRLLCIARDLATQLEEHEREEKETAARVSELTLRVETLSGELDVVRMTAREARTETQAVTRQRDMYRALLNRYDIEVSRLEDESMEEKATCESANENAIQLFDSDVPPGPGGKHPAARSSSDGNTNTTNAERLEETLASLDTEFKRYREDKLESDKIYTTTIEQLRKESSDARLLNQKLAAQLDFSHEKLRIMETNISGYKQEITVLREMNARYSTSAAASEAELARLREDLLRTSDKLLEVEVDARHSARQLELARANETRWKQENEALRRQDQMHTQLMHQLEAIQGNLEQRESHDRSLLDRRVSQLEKQLTEAQSAFTEASQSCKTIKQTLEQELELTRQKLADERAEAERLRTQLAASEQELNELQPKKDAKAVTTSEESTEHVMHEIAMESASRIRELQSEVDGLRMRLDSARQQTEQMRALATEAETRLVETTEENKQLEQRLSQELNENKQSKSCVFLFQSFSHSWPRIGCEFLEAQLDLEKKERQNLVNENIRTTEEAHHMNAELRRELTDLQSDLESVRARCESALQLEAGAKAEIEAHERFAQEAREKYERELALHAQDVEASSLTEARKQADDLKTQIGDLQRHCSAAESKAQAATDELTAQNTQWQSERERLTEKLQQSDKDQSLLQEQLIRLTQQLISLRRVMEHTEEKGSMPSPSSTDAVDSSGLGDLKTSEDLMQLVNYLRRQKNIAEASCDATAAENSRLLLRIANLEEQTDHLRTELNRERKASELATETTQRHSELMERVEQLNLVTESNRLLRHERETLRESLTEMENQRKLRRTEEELQHVQNKLNELRGELEGRIRKFEQDMTEANNSRQDAEKRCSEYSVQCDSLRKDLETRETTVVKLREIGRKYRQETETLRRQLAANQSDESHRQSIEEALTEARADVVNLRADLSVARTQKSQLAADLQDISQIIEELKPEMETMDCSHSSVSANTPRTPLMTATVSESATTENTSNQEATSVGSSTRPVSLPQSVVPAWIVRASTMQSVPPTPSVTPPNTTGTGSKQTAEIRPITSNVATVIPTPSLQSVPTASLATPCDSLFTPIVQISPSHSATTQESAGLGTTSVTSSMHTFMDQSNLFRSDPVSSGSVRNASTRRSSQATGESQSTVVTTSLPFGWLSGAAAQSGLTSFVSASGKRRLDEMNTPGEAAGTTHSHSSAEEGGISIAIISTVASVSSPDGVRTWDTQASSSHATSSGLSALFSEAKRPRQTGTTAPMTTTQNRPIFGHSLTPQATASRLFPHIEHADDSWSSVTTSVTGIVNPFTSSVSPLSIVPTIIPIDASVSSSTTVTSLAPVVRSSVAIDSAESSLSASREISETAVVVPHSSEVEFVQSAGKSSSTAILLIGQESEPCTTASKPAQSSLPDGIPDTLASEVHESQQSLVKSEKEEVVEPLPITEQDNPIVLTTDQPCSDSHESGMTAQETEAAPSKEEPGQLIYQSNVGDITEDRSMEEDEEDEEGDEDEIGHSLDVSEDESEPCFDDDEGEEGEIDADPEEEEVGEGDEEEEDLDVSAPVERSEIIELSSESDNSRDADENLEDYAEEETQQSEHQVDDEEEEDEEEEEVEGDQITQQPTEVEVLESEEAVDYEDREGADDDEHDDGSSFSEDEAEDYELTEQHDGATTQSRVDIDTELVEQADENSQLIGDLPATCTQSGSDDMPPTAVFTVSSSTTSALATTSSSKLFSLHCTAVTSSTASDPEPNLFMTSNTSHRVGLFSGARTPLATASFSQLPKPSSFSNTDTTGVVETSAGCSSSTSSLFRPSVLSSQFQPSSSASLPKPSLFGHPTPSPPVPAETVDTVSTTVSASNTTDSGPNRPKIQPIVWDTAALPGTSGQKTTEEPVRIGAGRRKKWGSNTRTSLFSGTTSSSSTGGSFSTARGPSAAGSGALRTKPHTRR
ncbi:hypothetical protein FGIG_08431 [Fasciola gigantica]|uniref:Nucleoprotein TPR n=1 Tax=Fasciola gigantica TaxID=46835 RepID=A0A504XR88_FASGI|nr:hypothetical protein FGIG_08431 [Fasciola gigantica]